MRARRESLLFWVFVASLRGGSASPATFVPPIQRQIVVNGETKQGYVLEFRKDGDTTTFECLGDSAGRPVAFKLNARSILLETPHGPSGVWGSSFWPSPQSTWGWPPPVNFDEAAYGATFDESTMSVTFTGPVDPTLGVRIVKRYSIDLNLEAIVHSYTIEMVDYHCSQKSFAPWIISRVASGGLSFYGQGPGDRTSGPFPLLPVQEVDGIAWFNGVPDPSGNYKLFSNSSRNWLASIGTQTTSRLAFVTQFEQIGATEHAPGEAQVEIFTLGDYVELEVQGAYKPVTPEAPLTWTAKWYLRELPTDIPATVGNAALVGYVDRLVSASHDDTLMNFGLSI